MGRLHLTLPVAAACMVLASVILCAPVVIEAAQITVPGNYATIQAAITAALPGDTVVVAPGTYDGPITLKDGVDLRGSETARTVLSLSGSSGPVMTVDGNVTVTISSFTFQNAAIGIRVTGDPAAVAITNRLRRITWRLSACRNPSSQPGHAHCRCRYPCCHAR